MSQEKEKNGNPKCFFNTRASPAKNTRAKFLKKDEKIPLKPSEEDEYQGLAGEATNEPNLEKHQRTKYRSGDTRDFKTKWKTEICHFWNMNGQCKYGENCAFAHGENEMKKRKMSASYKTKQCKQFFENGYCSYGLRCQFSHKAQDKPFVSYLMLLSEFDNEKSNEQLQKRPRLKTFENLIFVNAADDIEKNKKSFNEDIDLIQQNIASFDTKDNEEKEKEEEQEKKKRKRYSSL